MCFCRGTPGKSGGCPVGIAGAARVALKSSRRQALHCAGVKLRRAPHHRQHIGRHKDGAGPVRGPSAPCFFTPPPQKHIEFDGPTRKTSGAENRTDETGTIINNNSQTVLGGYEHTEIYTTLVMTQILHL